ncbi:MAG: NAD(P)H-dependent oxidoreductase, partial [Flavobacteriaceae bacterium]
MAAILAFAGSNSSTSINHKLVKYTTSLIDGHEVQSINMHHLPFPMYSEDHERENGYTNSLIELRDDILKSDGLIISVNEHNSNPSAFFKNLIDWL